MQNKSRAFTLIELLVVVLIIGILAAVAVPQYTTAVNKSRFANLRSVAMSFVSAAQVYKLANGNWPDNFEDLGVNLPGGFEITNPSYYGSVHYTCGQNDQLFCCLFPKAGTANPMITCSQKDESFAYAYFLDHLKAYCIADPDKADALKLCQSVTGKKNGNGGWSHYTPTGAKTGHYYSAF